MAPPLTLEDGRDGERQKHSRKMKRLRDVSCMMKRERKQVRESPRHNTAGRRCRGVASHNFIPRNRQYKITTKQQFLGKCFVWEPPDERDIQLVSVPPIDRDGRSQRVFNGHNVLASLPAAFLQSGGSKTLRTSNRARSCLLLLLCVKISGAI